MSYNIRLDLASDGANAWPFRRRELIGQIEIVRPDIIGLQEVVPGQRSDIAGALRGYAFLGVAREDGKEAGEYSLLGVDEAKFRVLESGTFWLSPTPDLPSLGWDAGFKRIVTWARLRHRKTATPVLVLNTHWDHRGVVARQESAGTIGRWLDAHRRKGERLLLLGDFNAPLSEQSMRLLAERGLRSTREAAESVLGTATSFNGFQAIPPEREAIDHVLVGEEWTVRRHATIAQHVGGRAISDHFPVVADVETKPKRCAR
jgi:endonuclease/exonuclease/phosphatase family metal-dependent hydrolase